MSDAREIIAGVLCEGRAVDNWLAQPSDYDAADAILSAMPDIVRGMVKPLEWDNRTAQCGTALYRVHIGYGLMNGHYALTCNGNQLSTHPSEQDAKAAANAHNAERVLGALGLDIKNDTDDR